MSSALEYLKLIIEIQLLWSFAVTGIVYTLPADAVNHISFVQQEVNVDLTNTSTEIQQSLQKQMDIPVIDLGALVFYSGNIVIDLMLNFFTAIPGMFNILLTIFLTFINVDAYLATQLKLLSTAVLTIAYLIGILQFLLNVRARGTIV
ncbi:hypothetical protein [Geoglobus ahangari]